MAIQGKRVKIDRWIHALQCVVKVQVDAVIPDSDPSEPCLDPHVLQFLDDLQDQADRGLIGELAKVGEVYVRRSA